MIRDNLILLEYCQESLDLLEKSWLEIITKKNAFIVLRLGKSHPNNLLFKYNNQEAVKIYDGC